MSYKLCLLMLIAITCNAEYTSTLLDKTFSNKTREVRLGFRVQGLGSGALGRGPNRLGRYYYI